MEALEYTTEKPAAAKGKTGTRSGFSRLSSASTRSLSVIVPVLFAIVSASTHVSFRALSPRMLLVFPVLLIVESTTSATGCQHRLLRLSGNSSR
ncbi:hypothetical protein ES703_114913 [subsurface metagenome]